MQSVLPYTTNPAQIASIEKLKLINPSSAAATGPYVSVSDPKLVVGGLLHNWDAEAAHALLNAPKSVQTWDLSWTEDETNWEERVHRCTYPEEVEDLLPAKWIGYRVQSDVDETLARVCKLCTVLVDRFVSLSQGNNANVSTAKWRQRQALYDRLGAVMELLEASVGEAIPILKLKDAEFIHNCWRQMQDDERVEIMSVLGTKECFSYISRRSAMRRFTARLQLLTFETLVCGTHGVLPPPTRLAAACARAKEEFASQCSTSAPPPTMLTTAVVATHLLNNNLRDAAAVLVSHPCQQQVLEGVRDYVRQHPGVFSVSTLTGIVEEARCVSEGAVATFLRAAVDEFLHGSSAASREGDEAASWDVQRENLRSLVLRHIRFYPVCVSFLLGSLCAVSRGCAGDREDVIEVMQLAMRERSMNPQDFGGVLDVVWKSREPRRVAMMWGWMQHTSACWDVRAASIAIMAFSELHQMDEAVGCMQKLAEADCDPTIDAQVAFVRFLGARTPSLLQYAAQLVLHWHPSGERLWRGEAQAVGMELVKICCACGERKLAVEMLEQMVATNAGVPAELEAFMLRPGAAALGEHHSASVTTSKTLQELFIDVPLRLPNLGEQPGLVGLLLSLGMATNRLPEVYDALEKASLTPANFQGALDCFTTGSVVKAASPVAVLACVCEAGARTGHKIPEEMESWLQLATEM